jgi:hypothetical protein
MPDFYISKIKIRRGTNDQRKSVRLDQGEPAFTTDTNRLYIGNGVLSGGVSVTAKNHIPLTNFYSLSNTYSEVGDIASIDNIWYQLTANPYTDITKWGKIATKVSQEFEYDSFSTINLKLSGLSASKINPNTVDGGLFINNNKLQVNYNPTFFGLSANKLSLNAASITTRELLSTSFGNGLSGGNGNTITLRTNPTNFSFVGGVLTANYTSLYNSISSYSGKSQFFPPVSTYNSLTTLNANGNDVSTFDGVLYQMNGSSATELSAWTNISDTKAVQRSVFSTLTCLSAFTGNGSNINSSLSTIFNGRPSHAIDGVGAIPGLGITQFRTLSSNGFTTVVVNLSSAGFLTFEGDSTSKTGQPFGRFAIPIFAY